MASESDTRNDSPAESPTLEVLDGPSAGRVVAIGREDFVLGRVGRTDRQAYVERRKGSGFCSSKATRPRASTALRLPMKGRCWAIGDEIEVAGTRLVYRPLL